MTASYTNTFKSQGGFTIVEFLVVFTISAILIAVALPALNSYNRTQVLKTTAQELKSNLRSAQNKAISGEKACVPIGTTSLIGWYVFFDTSSLQYTIGHHCVNSLGVDMGSHYLEKTYKLKGISSISFDPSELRTILYKPVSNTVSFFEKTGSGDLPILTGSNIDRESITITLSIIDDSISVASSVLTISRNGEISVQ